ncbi:MAG: hypothetical protein GXX83_05925 [Gaiellales bacterium]|nr:hypothetical protein [Gaiellales bacterium]
MIDKQYLKDLASRRSEHGLVLTACLSTSRLDDWKQTAPTFLKSEFSRILREQALSKEVKRGLEEDLRRILEVATYEVGRESQGLVVMADGSQELFDSVQLPLRLKNKLMAEPYPHIRPLVHALSLMEPFVVVRVSRDDSSIYVVDWWQVTHEDDFTGPYLRSGDRETGEIPVKEYFAAARQESLVDLHFKEVSTALDRLLEETGIDRVALCGQHDIAAWFRRGLSQRTAACVAAEISCDATASPAQLLLGAREAVREARIAEMEKLAERINEGLGPQGMGVAGFDQTYAALARGQVQTLLVERGFRPKGCMCEACGHIQVDLANSCPSCGGQVTPLDDALSEAVRIAVLQSSEVEVVERVALLHEMGGVAALLRFK